jgi:hypothetical protein
MGAALGDALRSPVFRDDDRERGWLTLSDTNPAMIIVTLGGCGAHRSWRNKISEGCSYGLRGGGRGDISDAADRGPNHA